ncbi:hypothetical protein IMF27_25250 [Pseudomonas sp. PCH199]|nr:MULTISPECIES: hypothetical protein [unclassified Pseudomonas]MCW8278456.1 hypothetical protein [Pseudomonas sp. PCH199]
MLALARFLCLTAKNRRHLAVRNGKKLRFPPYSAEMQQAVLALHWMREH